MTIRSVSKTPYGVFGCVPYYIDSVSINDIYPDCPPVQSVTQLLYGFGMLPHEIAELRGISGRCVRESLKRVSVRERLGSIEALRAFTVTRLLVLAFEKTGKETTTLFPELPPPYAETLKLFACGFSREQIATRLQMSPVEVFRQLIHTCETLNVPMLKSKGKPATGRHTFNALRLPVMFRFVTAVTGLDMIVLGDGYDA